MFRHPRPLLGISQSRMREGEARGRQKSMNGKEEGKARKEWRALGVGVGWQAREILIGRDLTEAKGERDHSADVRTAQLREAGNP